MIRFFGKVAAVAAVCLTAAVAAGSTPGDSEPEVIEVEVGRRAVSDDFCFSIQCVARKSALAPGGSPWVDRAVHSPKSVAFHPLGRKFYVNSLEGCETLVYDAFNYRKLATVSHRFDSATGSKWATPSGFYPFTHYRNGENLSFSGKPVELAFSADGRYLFVPYYRRTFDINAQDPSALAVIDTRADTIVRMFETGPLPKMVAVSADGKTLAVTHWGDNTVGLIDISSPDPQSWHHRAPVTIGRKLELDFSLTERVDRDKESGLLLRGTLFMPGDSILLVSAMHGSIAVVDPRRGVHLGNINDIWSVRHLITAGDWLYASRNVAGDVWRVRLDSLQSAIKRGPSSANVYKVNGWQSVKVGRGVRTIVSSPDGRWIYAVCNGASKLVVISTSSFEPVTEIDADSYPVGLAVSPDATTVVVTSQGRSGRGGHCVDIYKVPLIRN